MFLEYFSKYLPYSLKEKIILYKNNQGLFLRNEKNKEYKLKRLIIIYRNLNIVLMLNLRFKKNKM